MASLFNKWGSGQNLPFGGFRRIIRGGALLGDWKNPAFFTAPFHLPKILSSPSGVTSRVNNQHVLATQKPSDAGAKRKEESVPRPAELRRKARERPAGAHHTATHVIIRFARPHLPLTGNKRFRGSKDFRLSVNE